MKVAVILLVAMVMMMNQETESWRRFWTRIEPVARRIPVVRQVETGVRAVGRAVRAVGRFFRRWGKREIKDDEFEAAFNAAAADGILSEDEIQSVLGVSADELAEFIENFDMDNNGEISVSEYFFVTASSEEDDEE
ncbi:hypothetical protein LOTGIDRAFT_234279 [Lottia gigantea]|uniref:EF-hand domain-containing protein n=1 Tax=Lottia gigantea TaxID=225164 RepID=V4A3C9_LOTGI|nr:hypothetical protein LOTGIDRAFT_234279 [Lottia gigantea]ESO89425.1 hypothetical protein LOTGIDRAFT_234279 [Lottia gigantea]